MKGILVVAHGSRVKETENTLLSVLKIVNEILPDIRIAHAFMEFSDQTLEKAVKTLVDSGVTEIKVVPYFLFMGVHLREDIPEMVKKCTADYPDIKVEMGEPLGADRRLAEILADRIKGIAVK